MSFRNSLLTALSEKFSSEPSIKEKIEDVVAEIPKTENPKNESKVGTQILDILKNKDKVMV